MKRIKIGGLFVLVVIWLFIYPGCVQKEHHLFSSDPTVDNGIPAFSPASPYLNIDQIKEGRIVYLPTGIEVSEERLLDLLASARIIYVGEAHDSLEDHQVQLKILKGLWERFQGKIAVGMEMFRIPVQSDLDRWIEGRLGDKDFQKIWYDNWRVDYGYYQALLTFIRENKIPLIALNAPHDIEVRVGVKGLMGLSPEDQKGLPEIDRNDPYHRTVLQAIYKGHGAGLKGFEGFYDTMLLWDETMAESVAQYLKSSAGADHKMVVFAGGFHVNYGFGIPRRLFRRLQEPYKIVIPYAKGSPEEKKMIGVKLPDLPLLLSDYVWVVRYRELESRKVLLGVQVEPSRPGVRILSVSPASTADEAGIKVGDIIVSFDEKEINEPFDLIYAVQQKKVGERVKIRIIREGKKIEAEVVMKPSPSPPM